MNLKVSHTEEFDLSFSDNFTITIDCNWMWATIARQPEY